MASKEPLYVIVDDQKVPFLRGMITHSLIEKGLTFQQAYEAASLVRDHVRKQRAIRKEELSDLIRTVVRERFGEGCLREKPRSEWVEPPTILVRGQDSDVPFSKGLLSRSLQASGLEPAVAYEIAREIENFLLRKNRREVSRDELRKLIYQTILQNYDSRYAERYLLWRRFRAPDKPLIILIGGATGTGKTSVATEIAHRLGIQKIVSTDTIRQIMRMMFSHDLLPAIHYSSYEAWKPLGCKNDQTIIQSFEEQSLRVLVGVKAMVDRAVQENFSLVLDGVHLVPGLMHWEGVEDSTYLVPMVISTLNRSAHLERFPQRQRQGESRPANRYREHFDSILKIQDYILEMAEQHGTPIIENLDFDETVSSILTVISNTLREKLQIGTHELISDSL